MRIREENESKGPIPCEVGLIEIIIVNWNSGEQLRACIESIEKHRGDLVRRVIVVDNDSSDGSVASVENFQGVTLIRAGSNLGFGKACNLGAAQSKGDYLLFLNPDAALYAHTLPKAIAHARDPKNSKVGIFGVQLLNENGDVARSCARFPTVKGFAAHALALNLFSPRLGHRMAEWDHGDTRKVDQVIGAFFWVRRELFVSLNGFDERFFVYFEEVDFSLRARNSGWSSIYLSDVQAFHAGGGTSNQVKAKRLFYSLRSRLIYSKKNFSTLNAFGTLLVTFFVEFFSRSVLSLLRGSLSSLRETWGAYLMLWQWLLENSCDRKTR